MRKKLNCTNHFYIPVHHSTRSSYSFITFCYCLVVRIHFSIKPNKKLVEIVHIILKHIKKYDKNTANLKRELEEITLINLLSNTDISEILG